jgi:hypothetical protein
VEFRGDSPVEYWCEEEPEEPEPFGAVFRKILRRRDFTWAEHGGALMRRRKAWYYQHEPRPGVTVIGDRLLELASGGRR